MLTLGQQIADRIEYDARDPRVLMACYYLHRQMDHSRSILALGLSRDLRLIARSMIEGVAQFAWAADDFEPRALRWARFMYIHEWRKLRARRLDGEEVDARREALLNQALQEFGEDFYSGQARKAKQEGKAAPSDPYDDNWSGLTARAIFEAVSFGSVALSPAHSVLYASFSDWQHWSIGGVDEGMSVVNGQFSYSPGDPADASSALRAGMFGLWTTIGLVNEHLRLGLDEPIMMLGSTCVRWWDERACAPVDTAAGA